MLQLSRRVSSITQKLVSEKRKWGHTLTTSKILFLLSLVLFTFGLVNAQQGKYVRKSVSSLESVWFKPGSVGDLSFDAKTFNKFIDFYIEIDRFDYNVLPADLLDNFRNEANSLEEVSSESLSGVLENTVINRIVEILNDPEVMKNRGDALKDEAAFQTFAATKAKSLGLTVDELETLMNSAYIYLPYIQSASKEVKDKSLTITLKGGVIWWKVKISSDGKASVVNVLDATTTGVSSIDPTAVSPLTKAPLHTHFEFGSEKWETTPEQYAQNDAMLAFCKNLGVKTKEINDFKLSAQIVEVDGKTYGFGLGHREGVHLDDGFHLMEFEENNDGEEVAVKKGFVRVSKTGDNIENSNNYTYANQLLGQQVSEGTVVMEHPRLGLDLRVKLGMVTGLSINKEYVIADLFTGELLFEDDVTSALAADVFLSYNLAPIIGITQTYLDLNFTFAMPVATFNEELSETPSIVPFILSGYLGGTKKMWFGSSNASLFAGAGLESLNLAGKLFGEDYVYSVRSIGFKAAFDFEKLLTADLSVNLGLQYKYALPPMQLAYKWGSIVDETYEGSDVTDLYPDLSLSALGFNIGINYALGELPINVFGFLDPFKKH